MINFLIFIEGGGIYNTEYKDLVLFYIIMDSVIYFSVFRWGDAVILFYLSIWKSHFLNLQ